MLYIDGLVVILLILTTENSVCCMRLCALIIVIIEPIHSVMELLSRVFRGIVFI